MTDKDEFEDEFEDDDVDYFFINDDEDEDDNIEEKEIEYKKPKGQPKQIGKHSLNHDSIFNSTRKKKKVEEHEEFQHIIENVGAGLEIAEDSLEESKSDIDYFRDSRLKDEIRKLLETYTEIKMDGKRKKPSKNDFNAYYDMLIKELSEFGYTKTEIFIELSGYFTIDNWWNMLKLLEVKWSNIIIQELKDKYGLNEINNIDFY